MANMGTLVVAGHRFPVTALALRGGQLVITAEGPGPCPAFTNEPAAVFGEDDQGMVQGGYITMDEAGPRDTVRLFVELKWTRTIDEGPRAG
jgi:hypothetical protein